MTFLRKGSSPTHVTRESFEENRFMDYMIEAMGKEGHSHIRNFGNFEFLGISFIVVQPVVDELSSSSR